MAMPDIPTITIPGFVTWIVLREAIPWYLKYAGSKKDSNHGSNNTLDIMRTLMENTVTIPIIKVLESQYKILERQQELEQKFLEMLTRLEERSVGRNK